MFIKEGLHHYLVTNKPAALSILEIGFGTGLNALLTVSEVSEQSIRCNYVGVEAYPVSSAEIAKLNYAEKTTIPEEIFRKLHNAPWEDPTEIIENFSLLKRKQFFSEISDKDTFNLIYFDAFGARVQPELWTEEIFSKMFTALKNDGVLVTYSAKGSVRRALQSVGFTVERLPGPPGKREMLRALKRS